MAFGGADVADEGHQGRGGHEADAGDRERQRDLLR
jgi:hypothetical protein